MTKAATKPGRGAASQSIQRSTRQDGVAGVNRLVSPVVPNPVSWRADRPARPIPNPFSTASLRSPAPVERQGPVLLDDRIELGRLGCREEGADNPSRLGDRADPFEVNPDLSPEADGDQAQFGGMGDVEPQGRAVLVRVAIELGLADRRGPESQYVGRLIEQSTEDFPECGPASDEPASLTSPDEPRGPRPFIVGEDRQFRARLGRVRVIARGHGASRSTIQARTSSGDKAGTSAPDCHSRSEGRPAITLAGSV